MAGAPAESSSRFFTDLAAARRNGPNDPAVTASKLLPGVRYYQSDGARVVRLNRREVHIFSVPRSVSDTPVDRVAPLQELTPSRLNLSSPRCDPHTAWTVLEKDGPNHLGL